MKRLRGRFVYRDRFLHQSNTSAGARSLARPGRRTNPTTFSVIGETCRAEWVLGGLDGLKTATDCQ
jgi:hypothetical protein